MRRLAALLSRFFDSRPELSAPRSVLARRRLFLERLEDRSLLTAGMLDQTFGIQGKVITDLENHQPVQTEATAMVVAPDEKIVVAGYSYPLGLQVARLKSDGSPDVSFGDHGRKTIPSLGVSTAVAVGADGSVFVVSYGEESAPTEDFAVAKLTPSGDLDLTFGDGGRKTIDFGGFERAYGIAIQTDGSVVLAGLSGQDTLDGRVDSFAVARLTPAGQLDQFFGDGGKKLINFTGHDAAKGVAIASDGSILVGGESIHPENGYRFAVARLDANGQPDTDFGDSGKQTIDISPVYSEATSLALQANGSIVVGGFTVDDFAVARFTATGQRDTFFGNGGKQTVDFGSEGASARSVAVGPDGSVVLAGGGHVARLNSEGQLDDNFGTDGKLNAEGDYVGLQAGGKIVLAGTGIASPVRAFFVQRLKASGESDTYFGSEGSTTVSFVSTRGDERASAVALAPDGKTVVAGFSASVGSDPHVGFGFSVARYNPDGSPDMLFGDGGKKTIINDVPPFQFLSGVVVESDGSIIISGTSYPTVSGRFEDFAVVRLTSTGTLDSEFGSNGVRTINFGDSVDPNTIDPTRADSRDFATCLAVQPDGSIVIGGYTGNGPNSAINAFAVVRLTSNGQLDPSFGDPIDDPFGEFFGSSGKKTIEIGSYAQANSIALGADGSIILAGFSLQGSGRDFAVARLNSDGSLAGTHTIDFGSWQDIATSVAIDPGGKILVAGYSDQGVAGYDFATARLTNGLQLDSSFGMNGRQAVDFYSTDDWANGIALQPDGSVVVAGVASQGSSGPDAALARLTPSGQMDSMFDSDGRVTVNLGSADDGAAAVAVRQDYKIVAAGWTRGNESRGYDFAVVRLHGAVDTDSDGISDAVDTMSATSSDEFSDGATTGAITARGDQTFTIVDAADPSKGILINAELSGGPAPATINIVGTAATLTLTAGDQVVTTHGSVDLQVVSGPILAEFRNTSGVVVATADLPAGTSGYFEPQTLALTITGTTGNDLIDITNSGATLNGSLITTTSLLSQLIIEGGGGADQYQLLGLPPTPFEVIGGDPVDRLTITSTGDSTDPADGFITLREAIHYANQHANQDTVADVITFNIPGDDPRHLYYVNDGVPGQVTLVNITATTEPTDATLFNPDPDWPHSWFSIRPASTALPNMTEAVTIDGYTQGDQTSETTDDAKENTLGENQGSNAILKIEIDGSSADAGTSGLVVNTNNSTIRGLVINRFPAGNNLPSSGIVLKGNNNRVEGNFIGVNVSGAAAGGPSLTYGVEVTGADADNESYSGNVVGTNGDGTGDAAERNVVSNCFTGVVLRGRFSVFTDRNPNLTDSVVAGNLIGTDALGTVAIPNSFGIGLLLNTDNNRIGTNGDTVSDTLERNIISGNTFAGIIVGQQRTVADGNFVKNTRIFGNYVGTDFTGTTDLHNGLGIGLNSTNGSVVGGNGAAQANVIAYNSTAGVSIGSSGGGYIGHGNTVQGNSIYGNVGLGIDLSTNQNSADGLVTQNTGQAIATVTNGLQNFPQLQFAVAGSTTRILGTLSIAAPDARHNPANYKIDVYANMASERQGKQYLGSFTVEIDPTSSVAFDKYLPWVTQAGQYLTATATDAAGNTSEFSAPLALVGAGADYDGDGISNIVDVQPTQYSNDFSDVGISGGITTGTIVDRGAQILTISDAPNQAHGVIVSTSSGGGSSPATVRVDSGDGQGHGQYTFGPGTSFNTTTGSVVTQVLMGTVEATFVVLTGETEQVVATASLTEGADLKFEPEMVTFIAAPTSAAPIEVVLIGSTGQEATATLSADNQIAFEPETFSFSAPPSNSEPVKVEINGEPVVVSPGTSFQPIQIDIKPGSSQNTLNLSSNGVIAVAILSTTNFDARHVLASSVLFAGASAFQSGQEDVNGDGRLDLVLHFRTQDTTLRKLYEELLIQDQVRDGKLDSTDQIARLSLTGETVDHVFIEGFDSLDLFLAGESLKDTLKRLFG